MNIPPKSNQEYFLLASTDQRHPKHFHINLVLRVTGQINEFYLEQALQILIARYDVLRMGFNLGSEQAEAILESCVKSSMTVVDRHASNEDEWFDFVKKCSYLDFSNQFDISKPPLFRFSLLRRTPQEAALIVTGHHCILDAWSLHILLKEFIEIYSSFLSNKRPHEPEPQTKSYIEELYSEHKFLESDSARNKMKFWSKYLGEEKLLSSEASASFDYDRPLSRITWPMQINLIGCAADKGKTKGVSWKDILLAVYAKAIAKICTEDREMVNFSLLNRGINQRRTVGLFSNAIPLRIKSHTLPNILDCANQLKHEMIRCVENNLPILHILKCLRPDLFAAHSALALTFWPSKHQFNILPRNPKQIRSDVVTIKLWNEAAASMEWSSADTELSVTSLNEENLLSTLIFDSNKVSHKTAELIVEEINSLILSLSRAC